MNKADEDNQIKGNTSEQDENIEHQIALWSLIKLCIEEFKNALETDLDGYQHLANYLQPHPRSAFLYSVVREIERTQHSEILHFTMAGQIKQEESLEEEAKYVLQQVLEDFLKPQIRKMKEFIARLCLFCSTNEDVYYRHYMLLEYL